MDRCPRCNVDLAPHARFCPHCGFNHTKVRMQTAAPQPMPEGNTSDAPATVQKQVATPIPINLLPPPVSEQSPALPAHLTALAQAYQSRPYDDAVEALSYEEDALPGIERVQQTLPETKQSASPAPETAQMEEDAETKARGLSLTQRYLSEQETRYHEAVESSASATSEPVAKPELCKDRAWDESETAPQMPAVQREIEAISTMVHLPKTPLSVKTQRIEAPPGERSESLIATSKAAERWRQSWRDRQRAEAGPALDIPRGQAVVPAPLMSMQNSIARMRAIVIPQNNNGRQSRSKNFSFWFTLILLLCLIGGLCAYVIWTYLPSTQFSALTSSAGSAPPDLTMQSPHTNTIPAGQTLYIYGEHFGSNHAITFILDTTPLSTHGIQSNNKGTFDASLSIPATWLAGNYMLQAQDNQSGLHAFLELQILPGKISMSNNTPLKLTTNEQPITAKSLAFKAIVGKGDPGAQRITLTNTGVTSIQWSVSTATENNLSWLLINDGKTGGTLASGGIDSVDISISSMGLKSSAKPYTGSIIFTVNQAQAIIPVSLVVQDSALEVVINPNPVIAYLQGGGTCQPTTLTLINLSNQVVTWNANPYDADKPHIHLDGQTSNQGTLDPSGQSTDTKVVQITCISAQVGEKLYHISVYYNGVAVNVPVSIRYP